MSRALTLLWCAVVPLALLVACSTEKHVRIVIVPDQSALSDARRLKVNVTDLVFKKNQANRIEEHPFFFSRDQLQPHGDGCGESLLTLSVSKKEEVVWEADSRFRILDIAKNNSCASHPSPEGSLDNPFYGTMPYTSTPAAPFNVHSGPARHGSEGQVYKIKIDIGGQILDPDIFCMM